MMYLWIVLALLTAAVAVALLLPFARSASAAASGVSNARRSNSTRAGEVEVYRDQLREIDRDREGGLISTEEAENARAEVGRRLIAAAAENDQDNTGGAGAGKHRIATALVTVVPPALGLCLYLSLGNPGIPDQPLQARLENPGNNIALLVTKVERHLAENPTDGAGWDILAPIYLRLDRAGDAELAYRNAIRFIGPSNARYSGLGETLVVANDGIVTEAARQAFEQAVKLDPTDPRSRFYAALGLEQGGRKDEARAAFEELASATPADAPWKGLLDEHIVKNGGTPLAAKPAAPSLGGPTQEDVAAAQDLSQGDRKAMIAGMVDSLAAKLKDEPDNIEGWLRLVRSYAVLGDEAKARDALSTGLAQFPPDGNDGKRLLALGKDIGLDADASPAPGGARP